MTFKKSLLIFIIAFSITGLKAQYYDTGEDPSSLKWFEIKTKHFRVIFPEDFLKEGTKYSRVLDSTFSLLSNFYPRPKGRVPVIIHNHTTFSNGYVAWAPRRMELYPTPEQGTIPLDNTLQLALHESAHIMQMRMLNRGLTRGLSAILGEQATGAAAALLPLWYLEGDAVFSETLFSESGRGRLPSFERELKAIAIDRGKQYSYDKMLNGSFRSYTPDHYRYGYQMVAWTYAKFNTSVWNNAVMYAGKNPYTVVPVNVSLLKSAGLTKGGLYKAAFSDLSAKWREDDSKAGWKEYTPVNTERKKDFVNYHSPVAAGKDRIIAVRTSLSEPARFVLINTATKTEKRLYVPGNIYPYRISGNSEKTVWVETVPDPRWSNRDYSVIKTLDIQTGAVSQLTRRSRIMSVALSPDGMTLAAIENSISNVNTLILINAVTGEETGRFFPPSNAWLQRPEWTSDSKTVVFITLINSGEGVMSFATETSEWKELIKPSSVNLGMAAMKGDTLFWTSSVNGTDQVYMKTGQRAGRVTSSRFGTEEFTISGNRIIITDYTSAGKNISQLTDPEIIDTTNLQSPAEYMADRISRPQADNTDITGNYTAKKYYKALNLFRPHSWMPLWADIEEIQSDPLAIRPGATVMSQNLLSTLVATAGYEYSREGEHLLHGRLTWKGWYPVITAEFDKGGSPAIYKKAADPDPSAIYPATTVSSTVYVPLSFSTGRFSQYVMPSVSAGYSNNYIYDSELSAYDYGQTRMNVRFYFSNVHKTAYRDIYPRWAQIIDLRHTWYPADKSYYGTAGIVKTTFYSTGFLRNHGLRLRFEHERQTPEKFLLSNSVNFPRGYDNIISEVINFGSADYTFPVLYPDFNIPSVLFLKRLRASLFYDFARGTRNRFYGTGPAVFHNYTEDFKSFGFEFLADFNLLRIPFPLTAGICSSWKENGGKPMLSPVFRIEIYGMRIGKRNREGFRF